MGLEAERRPKLRDEDVVRAFTPITRTVLIFAAAYYAFIALSHPFFETGFALVLLATLATVTSVAAFALWLWLGRGEHRPWLIELFTAVMFLLFAANVFAFLTIHLQPPKLVYFVLLALVAAGSTPTPRVALVGVLASMAGLAWFAPRTGPGFVDQYGYLGLTSFVVATGLALVTRGTIVAELRARLQSEALAQHAEEANRAKTDFLAAMSHEIRNPLNGILGAAQLLQRDPLSQRQKARVDIVMESGRALVAILDDLLDLSRIEAGKLELNPAPFSLETLAETAQATLDTLGAGRDLGLELVVLQSEPGDYVGDLGRIGQILRNLIANAVKFTEHGEVRVTLAGDAAGLTLAVSDTGIGIPADKLERLFERFVQADATTPRRFGGTGLGLAICRELCEAMGGTITAVSVEGKGSCFTATLPLELVEPTVELEAAPAASRSVSARAAKVLVAEDDEVNRSILCGLLENLGLEPIPAEDGEAAMEAFKANRFDLVLLDIQMPRLDGVTAARCMRDFEHAAGLAPTPILAITANVMKHQLDAYGEAGMDGWVGKPVDAVELESAIAAVLAPAPA